MPMGSDIDSASFIAELRGMREDSKRVSEQLVALTVEIKHLAHSQEQTFGFGERIRSLETDVVNLKAALKDEEANRVSSERSAATERRWVIGTVLGTVLALAGFILTVWKGTHP